MIRRSPLAALFAAGLALSASAATVRYHATLDAASEVPPTKSRGAGEAQATLDTTTHQLTHGVTFQGFASPVTMARFHGPAPAGENAGVQVWLSEQGKRPTSPLRGAATLTPEQQRHLEAGMWHVNIHTANNPGGAIRGQLTPVR